MYNCGVQRAIVTAALGFVLAMQGVAIAQWGGSQPATAYHTTAPSGDLGTPSGGVPWVSSQPAAHSFAHRPAQQGGLVAQGTPITTVDDRLWMAPPAPQPGQGPLVMPDGTTPFGSGPATMARADATGSELRPPDARPGMFQKLRFETEWLSRNGQAGLGIYTLEANTLLAFPIFGGRERPPLLVTPGAAVHYLDGPVGADVPPRVYSTYVKFRHMRPLGEDWAIDLSVTPGFYSDFEAGPSDAMQISGYGVAVWGRQSALQLMLGVAYLDRVDPLILPVGGLIWEPHDAFRAELTFPRPNAAWRVDWFGPWTEESSYWVNLGLEFGSETWAIERSSGRDDVLSYWDYRLIAGLERRHIGGLDWNLDVAYCFGRKIEFQSAAPNTYPNDCALIRLQLIY